MLISVVMPCFNAEAFIASAVRSALDQDGVNVELIVQDGASTDGTLAELEAIDDPRVSVESAPDSGQSEALNRALARARGEWVLWLNADDLVAPGALKELADDLEGPWDLVYGDAGVIDDEGALIGSAAAGPLTAERVLSGRTWVFSGSTLFRPRLLERAGAFDPALHYCMDFEWLLRAMPHAQARHRPVTIGLYRLQPGAKSVATPRSFLREAARIRRRHARGSTRRALAATIGQVTMSADILTRGLRAPLTELRVRRRKRAADAQSA